MLVVSFHDAVGGCGFSHFSNIKKYLSRKKYVKVPNQSSFRCSGGVLIVSPQLSKTAEDTLWIQQRYIVLYVDISREFTMVKPG